MMFTKLANVLAGAIAIGLLFFGLAIVILGTIYITKEAIEAILK